MRIFIVRSTSTAHTPKALILHPRREINSAINSRKNTTHSTNYQVAESRVGRQCNIYQFPLRTSYVRIVVAVVDVVVHSLLLLFLFSLFFFFVVLLLTIRNTCQNSIRHHQYDRNQPNPVGSEQSLLTAAIRCY